MAQVHNDSNAVHQLRQSLNGTIADLKKQQTTCKHLIVEAASFWKDDKYKIFSNDYDQGTKVFEQLFTKMADYDKKLLKLEMALRDYEKSDPRIRKR